MIGKDTSPYPGSTTFSAKLLLIAAQSQKSQDILDRILGRQLRAALLASGPSGRVVIQHVHDEILFYVDSGT